MSQLYEHNVTMTGHTIQAYQKLDEFLQKRYDEKDLKCLTDDLRFIMSKV